MRKYLLLLALFFICEAAGAQPFRFLPPAGERGRTGEGLPLPDVKIDRRVLRLGPGALIFDQSNRSVVHGQLPVGADVFYTRDLGGNIQRIYILTDEEKARLTANPRPKVAPDPAAGQAPLR
jgi:hypothetical protein